MKPVHIRVIFGAKDDRRVTDPNKDLVPFMVRITIGCSYGYNGLPYNAPRCRGLYHGVHAEGCGVVPKWQG